MANSPVAFDIIVVALWQVAISSQVPSLSNNYPETGNFGYVNLTCRIGRSPAVNAEFRWNNASALIDVMEDVEPGEGTMAFVLTQEKEGEFSCVADGKSSNTVLLTAQPPHVEKGTEIIYVTLYHRDETVVHELQCGIQPGALIEKYNVEWTSDSNSSHVLGVSNFNLSLNVTAALNGTSYQCIVTIDHDGSDLHERNYSGGEYKLLILLQEAQLSVVPDESTNTSMIIALGVVVCVLTVIAVISALFLYVRYHSARKKTADCFKTPPIRSTSKNIEDSDFKQNVLSETKCQRNNCGVPMSAVISNQITEQRIVVSSLETSPPSALCTYMDDNNGNEVTGFTRATSSVEVSEDSSLPPNKGRFEGNVHLFTGSYQLSPFPLIHDYSENLKLPTSMYEIDCSNPHCQCQDLQVQKHLAIQQKSVKKETECTNPQCQCHDLRMQKFLTSLQVTDSSVNAKGVQSVAGESSQSIPTWLTRVHVLRDCNESGILYTNESNGFILEIPEAAIPKGLNLTIDVGVTLHGPFQYPENVQRVSPIVWVCVREFKNFHFLKPVKISMQHCLKVEDCTNSESLGLEFLKAGHTLNLTGFYTFLHSNGSIESSSSLDYLTLTTDHFCFMCLVSNVSADTVKRIQYCLSPFYPQPVVPNVNDVIHFYVSFFLNACLTTIDNRFEKGYRRIARQYFTFDKHSQDKSLKIVYFEPENWILSLQCSDEIRAEDVDFHHKDYELLRRQEEHGIYPPKFTVGIIPPDAARSIKAHFSFFGAKEKIAMDIPLQVQGHDGRKVPQLSSETRYTLSPVANVALAPALMAYKTQTPSLPLVSFMEHIAVRIRTKWRFFGIMLDIPADVLDSFPAHDCLQCFSRVFDYWARRGSPQVSWETVVSILDSETVDEKSLAAEIRKAFLPSLLVRPDCDSRRDLSTYGHSNSAHSSRSSDNGYASNTSNSSMMVSDV